MVNKEPSINIREAKEEDLSFVTELMDEALEPYHGDDHRAHARRIFSTHISGGKDQIGHFSFEQKMFIITVDDNPAGVIHIVGKRQGTYKISPIIVGPQYRGKIGLGKTLLDFAENYAKNNGARQMYCTVSEQNKSALQFFIRHGYTVAGQSDSHYKSGITEVMLYKLFVGSDFDEKFDRVNISVHLLKESYESQVRQLLLDTLPDHFQGIDSKWSLDITREDFMRPIRTKHRYLDLIKNGQKTLEVRVDYEHIKTIQPGEHIKFCSRTEAIIARVKSARKYPTLDTMLGHEDATRIIPGLPESKVLEVLREIYPPELESLGVIVLEIQVESERDIR